MAKTRKNDSGGNHRVLTFVIVLLIIVFIAAGAWTCIYWDKVKAFFSGNDDAGDDDPTIEDPSGEDPSGSGDIEDPSDGGDPEIPGQENVTKAGLLYAWVESEKNITLLLEESSVDDVVFPDGSKPESCIKITTVLPSQESAAMLTCDASWVNAASDWVQESVANGQILQAYVRVENGTNCFYVYCMERFNEKIRLDIYSMTNENVSGVVMLEYDYFDIKPEGVETNVDNIVF